MTFKPAFKIIAACAIAACAAPAFSHIVLETKTAVAGSTYKAVFQVGHGCQGSPTTGVTVQIPSGFIGAKPFPKAGWTLAVKTGPLATPYQSHGRTVSEDVTSISWTAASKEAALPEAFFDEFVLRGSLPAAPAALWFKVLQTCENGSADWSEVPASGTSTKGLKSPAPLLEVVAASAASAAPTMKAAPAKKAAAVTSAAQPVQVTGAWARATVPGQAGSGAFMAITSKAATRLVGVSTPVAGVAEVHEMKMQGDVMKMGPVTGIDLPAGKTVELKSGGYHVMLMDLKQTLAKGSSVPLTLHFKNAQGVESKSEIRVPVSLTPPVAAAATPKTGNAADKADEHAGHDMNMR